MKKINWGKMYDKRMACLVGTPTYFCGSRPNKQKDIEHYCYECLNNAVKGKSEFKKFLILLKLIFIDIIGTIRMWPYKIKRLFRDEVQF